MTHVTLTLTLIGGSLLQEVIQVRRSFLTPRSSSIGSTSLTSTWVHSSETLPLMIECCQLLLCLSMQRIEAGAASVDAFLHTAG